MDRRYFLIGLTTAFTFCAAPILAITKAGAKKLVDSLVKDINKVIASGKSQKAMYSDFEKIFERFYRVDPARSRNKGGTGLGLSIVKHVVERYQGRIKLVSRPGQGASFSVTFPILQPDPTR